MSRTPGAKDKQKRKPRSDGGKPAYENSPLYQGQTQVIPEEYNARKIAFMREIIPDGPTDIHDWQTMEKRFYRYLQKCEEWGMKVGNQGAYIAMGITKQQAWQWESEVKSNPERADLIKKVKAICAYYREGMMEDGKINPVVGIFWQKNYDGMRDQQEVVLTPNNPLGDQQSAESLKQKYLENTYGISEIKEIPDVAESAETVKIPVEKTE